MNQPGVPCRDYERLSMRRDGLTVTIAALLRILIHRIRAKSSMMARMAVKDFIDKHLHIHRI